MIFYLMHLKEYLEILFSLAACCGIGSVSHALVCPTEWSVRDPVRSCVWLKEDLYEVFTHLHPNPSHAYQSTTIHPPLRKEERERGRAKRIKEALITLIHPLHPPLPSRELSLFCTVLMCKWAHWKPAGLKEKLSMNMCQSLRSGVHT